jgi:hypothetical protein
MDRSDTLAAPDAPRPGFWARPLAAARANLVPGLVLQAFALLAIFAYYGHAPTREALDQVAAYKARTGYLYSFFATAFFGGLIPFLYLRLHPATRALTPPSHGVFLLLFWGLRGMEVDLFYRFQSRLWGDAVDLPTVAAKVVTDLFVYCPVWAAWTTLLLFQWKESGFDLGAMHRLDKAAFLKENLLTALCATWIVWLPAVAVIYSLPPALQIPLFNIVLCFFSLLYAALTRRSRT